MNLAVTADVVAEYDEGWLFDTISNEFCPPPPAVTPMTGSEVGGSLNRLGGAPDPPGEGEERQAGLAAWGVQVGCVNSLGT